MAAGTFHSPLFTIAWPSGEFGAMGLEGAVSLGFAKELAAQPDAVAHKALFDKQSADVKKAMLEAGDATAAHLGKAQDDSIGDLLAKWKAAGIDVFEFSKDQLKTMDDAMAPVNEEWVTRVGKQHPQAKALLEQYQKVLASQ